MKIKNLILVQFSIILIIILLSSSCNENQLNEITVFSGSWRIVMSDANSLPIREAEILIYDYGSFCNRVLIYPLNDSLYIAGNINKYGDLVAIFGDQCGVNLSGMLTGNIAQVLGITYGSGTWNDTLRNANAHGTWAARRY